MRGTPRHRRVLRFYSLHIDVLVFVEKSRVEYCVWAHNVAVVTIVRSLQFVLGIAIFFNNHHHNDRLARISRSHSDCNPSHCLVSVQGLECKNPSNDVKRPQRPMDPPPRNFDIHNTCQTNAHSTHITNLEPPAFNPIAQQPAMSSTKP